MVRQSARIVVINPNSTDAITHGLADALRRFQGVEVRCLTLAEGPPGIETEQHIRDVESPLVARIRAEESGAAAFVIACFSDPGLYAAREATKKPVVGIARAGLMTARSLADQIGVVSILETSVARHRELYDRLGMQRAVVGDRALGMHVTELASHPDAKERLLETGRLLCEDGARAIVLGCTGLTGYRAWLEETLEVPVIDPTVAAVSMAIGTV